MIRRFYKRLKKSTAKLWFILGGLIGIGMLPCPECGTPMIFHVWPLAGIVLVVQMMKKRYQQNGQVDLETAPIKLGLPVSINYKEEHGD
ncbi:MAG: hypothetical protein GYA34_06900 [Chloroflexi bacterium]|nr:hypothetical protein [Chloroflexota bacterium]